MNWYKTSQERDLWKEIELYGPEGEGFTDDEEFLKDWGESAKTKDKRTKEYLRSIYFRPRYSWSVPTKKAIEEIKAFVGQETVLEIGSGLGLWSKLMSDAGINIIATDSPSKEHKGEYLQGEQFTGVEQIDHLDALDKYHDKKVLFLCWPPYDTPLAHEALEYFTGDKVIFIGEGAGGCTGCDNFFNSLNENWVEVKKINIPQWDGIHDRMTFWTRK